MHERSIFLFQRLFLSFGINLSTPRPRSD